MEIELSKTLTCFATGRDDRWEAICLDLDLAVTGKSFADVYATLNQAIRTYIEDARKEAPEQRRRLLARKAPLRVRLTLMGNFLWKWLWSGPSRGGDEFSFTVTCRA